MQTKIYYSFSFSVDVEDGLTEEQEQLEAAKRLRFLIDENSNEVIAQSLEEFERTDA